ncbi:DUF6893 family small protein [Salinactinospora qingdaonensis]
MKWWMWFLLLLPLSLAVVLLIVLFPDIKRYMRIRRM